MTYQQADSATFRLRQRGYAKHKTKAPSQSAVYELASVDLYSTRRKHFHVVRRLRLPDIVNSACTPDGLTLDEINIPQVLVIHILMPTYPATFFATTDGPNVSYIYCFRLPANFHPDTFHAPQVRLCHSLCLACDIASTCCLELSSLSSLDERITSGMARSADVASCLVSMK